MSDGASIWNPKDSVATISNYSSVVKQRYVATAGQITFDIDAFAYVPGTSSLLVYKNGVLLSPEVDVVETDGDTFTLVSAATAGDIVLAVGFIGSINAVVDPYYLGPKAAAPTIDNQGVTLGASQEGYWYWNTASNDEWLWTGTVFQLRASSVATSANLISVADASSYFTGTEVETILQELGAASVNTATSITVADTDSNFNGTNVEDVLKEIASSAHFFAHESVVPSMTILVEGGSVLNGIVLTTKVQQSIALDVADVINPRIDRIVLNPSTGVITKITGTPGVTPVAPIITAGNLPICQVSVPATDTTISDDQITDERTTIKSINKLIDSNGLDVLLTSAIASAVNEITVTNAAAGGIVDVSATGDDTDIQLDINSKGADPVSINGLEIDSAGALPADVVAVTQLASSVGAWIEIATAAGIDPTLIGMSDTYDVYVIKFWDVSASATGALLSLRWGAGSLLTGSAYYTKRQEDVTSSSSSAQNTCACMTTTMDTADEMAGEIWIYNARTTTSPMMVVWNIHFADGGAGAIPVMLQGCSQYDATGVMDRISLYDSTGFGNMTGEWRLFGINT